MLIAPIATITEGPGAMFRRVDLPLNNGTECPGRRSSDSARILVQTDARRQRIDGFGASFTDSSAYLVDTVLSDEERERIMTALFDQNRGIGLSVLRNPMGACDYARSVYSYDDMPQGESDAGLSSFSIAHDLDSILPLTRRARELNPALKLIASPWSAPAWMKTSQSMNGGSLDPVWYGAYANYFVRFIEEYRRHGVPVAAITVQNEPLYEPLHYPSMLMTAQQESYFVSRHLAPALRTAGLNVAILGYDHNWDRTDYADELLSQSPGCFDGIAWHWYAGGPEAQEIVAKRHPDTGMYFTEGSGGSWIPEFEPAFSNLLRNGIGALRHGARTFVLWNIALDQDNGPTVPGFGPSTCRGLMRIDTRTGHAAWTVDYYGLAHFSAFTHSGAMLVESTQDRNVLSAAFHNPDGSVVCVLFNDQPEAQNVEVRLADAHGCDHDGGMTNITLSGHAACTLAWGGMGTGGLRRRRP